MAILPSIHAQTMQFDAVRIGVQGPGTVYWTSTYNGATFTSGSTDTDTSIELPRGAIVTFTAVPVNGHFNKWIVDSYNEGSNNPYILWSTGANPSATVVADFYQYQNFTPNPPLQTPPPLQYDTIQVNSQGSGTVYWSASYLGNAYTSGSTDTTSTIVVPQGTIVTFTAVPTNGHFNNWIVNSSDEGSNNPYTLWSTGASPSATVVADF